MEKDVWENICSCRKYNFDYIFVYMLRGTKKQRKFIEGYAKKHKLKIITIPFLDTEKIVLYDSIFGDIKYWDANPADFISVIKYAKYVFTDSFHCMIFSCLYHKEFYVFPKIGKSQLNRMIDLQKVLGTGNRMIEMMTVEEINNFDKIDWKHVDRNIEQNRNKSKIYLYNCLGRGDLVNE